MRVDWARADRKPVSSAVIGASRDSTDPSGASGTIVAIDLLADPTRLSQIDLVVLDVRWAN
ncbi:MAG: hypothetical protein QOF01_895 [Thermomicrobiales bacterium]|jgi:hypothetical protein|nr:hypothetical protein [Thermomicrobiales bacterium]